MAYGAVANYTSLPRMSSCRKESGNNVDYAVGLSLAYGAETNIVPHSRMSAYRRKSGNCVEYVVRLSLAYGADAITMSLPQMSVDIPQSRKPVPASLLWTECKNGNTGMVIDLLKNGASTDYVDEKGETVLHCAIMHIENLRSDPSPIVSSLIEHRASVNALSEYGTPLYLACERGLTGVVQQLVQSNADVNLCHCKYHVTYHVSSM